VTSPPNTRFSSKNDECTASVASRCSVPRTCLFLAHCEMARMTLTSGRVTQLGPRPLPRYDRRAPSSIVCLIISPASLRRLRAFYGDTLAGIQRRITGPSLTGRSPVTCFHTGMQTRAPFRAQPRRPDLLPLAVVSSDMAGPVRPLSADGALHLGTLMDKGTRFTLGKALLRKSDAAQFVHDGLN
jgi:hypothetical protein